MNCIYLLFRSFVLTSSDLCTFYLFIFLLRAAFHHAALHYVRKHLQTRVPNLKRLRLWTDGHASTYKGYPNFGRMGYWPLTRPSMRGADAGVEDPLGYEDAEGIEIIHCFFEHDHASGVQDSVGKDARFPLLTQFGFKSTAVHDYHQCNEWSIEYNKQPDQNRIRHGHWKANGDYVWVAFSDGEDSHRGEHEVLDLRRKIYKAVPGCSQRWEFRALLPHHEEADPKPLISSRRLSCRCDHCRIYLQTGIFALCMHPEVTGDWHRDRVDFVRVHAIEDTRRMKLEAKTKRREKQREKAEELRHSSVALEPLPSEGSGAAEESASGDCDDDDMADRIRASYASSDSDEAGGDDP